MTKHDRLDGSGRIRTALVVATLSWLHLLGCDGLEAGSRARSSAQSSNLSEPPPRFAEREIAGLFGSEVELPQPFPEDIPRYPDAWEIGTVSTAGRGTMAAFQSADTPEKIRSFYREQLALSGWRVDRDADFGGEHVLSSSKGERTASIAITEAEGGAQITVRVAGETPRP